MYCVRKVLTVNGNLLIMRLSQGNFRKFQNHIARFLPPNTAFMSTISQFENDTELLNVLPSVVNSLVKNPKLSDIPEMSHFLQKLMEYNIVAGGEKSPGLMVISTYKIIENPDNITKDSLKKARTLACILEMYHAYFNVLCDMMDGSSTRRGKPSWHKLPDVGSRAANDAELLKFSIYEFFQTHFKKAPLYNDMVDLLNETLLYTTMGQHLYYTMAHRIKSDYSLFTIERYNSIVKYKTAYFNFKLPILLGYLFANNSNKELHLKVEDFCLTLGSLCQIQDDVLDCYGDESVTGKKGTDIQEGKCTWFAVHALKLSNDEQRAFFIENYADKDPAKVQNIKHLYEELNLQELYKREEKVIYKRIQKKANVLPDNDRKLMLKLLNIFYNRNVQKNLISNTN